MERLIYTTLLIIALTLNSCVKDPTEPEYKLPSIGSSVNGAYILCEGLWHYDNSTLCRFDYSSQSMINDFYSLANPNMRLGDLANGMARNGNYVYVVATSAGYIDKIQISTGKSIAKLFMPEGYQPRKIYIANDSIAFVSELKGFCLTQFNPSAMTITNPKISVGPAPEHLDGWQDYVYVANSGYGDYLANEPKAGTISVIDINQQSEIKLLDCGPNPIEVKVNKKHKKLYAVYYHLPSMKDSVGGIVEYDLNTLKETNRIRLQANALNFSLSQDTLLFVSKYGISIIDLNNGKFTAEDYIKNPNQSEKWYSLTVSPDNNIWVGNAKTYQVNGEILVFPFSKDTQILNKYNVGVNPNTILFF